MTRLDRITLSPDVMGGKPCIRGLRVTVGTIVGLVASGHTDAAILELYPYLEPEDIRQALSYAAWRSEEIEVPLSLLKLLIDMNLSPQWVQPLAAAGFAAVHWSEIGDPKASDRDILRWAREHGRVLLTHDLDFGAILAASQAAAPSVLQVRTRDVSPQHLAPLLIHALNQFREHLERGALVSLDETDRRVRLLPIDSL